MIRGLLLIVSIGLAGCQTASRLPVEDKYREVYARGFNNGLHQQIKGIAEYVNAQVVDYGDLCQEEMECQGTADDDMQYCNDIAAEKRGFPSLVIEAHYKGVECAAQSIFYFLKYGQ